MAGAQALADDLPRRGVLGASFGPSESGRGVAVLDVSPESAAYYAGIEAGDVLQKIGSVQLLGPDAVEHAVTAVGSLDAGDAVLLTVTKGTYTSHMTIELPELPRESHPEFETVYDAVDVGGALHRVIVTKPKGEGPFPAVFYIQDVHCESVEAPLNSDHPVRRLVSGFTEAGYVTLRVEKRGVGDSEGAPCGELDFETERAGYAAGLAHLKALPYVNADRVFLFGHGMGGVFAPLIAAEEPIAGIVPYGEAAESPGGPVDAADARPARFWEQRQAVDLQAAWKAVAVPLLAIRGGSTLEAGADAQSESAKGDTPPFSEALVQEIVAWMNAR